MSDIVDRLRAMGRLDIRRGTVLGATLQEAADEIERFRAALAMALPILECDRLSLVRSHSTLRRVGDVIEVVPGSLDPEAAEDVACYDGAIAAARAALGDHLAGAGKKEGA